MGCRSGQALVETILTLPVLGVGIAALLYVLYFGVAVIWADFCSYEGALCLAENQSIDVCTSNANAKLKWLPKTKTAPQVMLTRSKEIHIAQVLLMLPKFSIEEEYIQYVATYKLDEGKMIKALPSPRW